MKSPREGTPHMVAFPGHSSAWQNAHRAITEAAVSNRSRYQLVFIGTILTCAILSSSAQDPQKQKLDREYQSAVADYDAGRYAAAEE